MTSELVGAIRIFAKNKEMTLAKLEKDAGLTQGAISHWNHHSPRVSSIRKVTNTLGIEMSALFREMEKLEKKRKSAI